MRGWRRECKWSRRRVEGRKGRGKWKNKWRKRVRRQVGSEGLFRIIPSDTCKEVRTLIEFPRSVTPDDRGERESKRALRFSEEFLEVKTAKFTNRVHEVNDRAVIPFNKDTRWAVLWKVPGCHKHSVSRTNCFSIGGIRTREERHCKGVKKSQTLGGVFPQNNSGTTNAMFAEGSAVKLYDEI